MPLPTRIRVHQNPWEHRIPNRQLVEILTKVADLSEQRIRLYPGEDDQPASFAQVILDPTAPMWAPSHETLLAIIEIGPDAERLVENAIAKGMFHRDHGVMAGYGVFTNTVTSADGDFAWGFSSKVDDSIGAGSGLTQEEDALEAGLTLVHFNYEVRAALKRWFASQEAQGTRPSWFCNTNQPGKAYSELAKSQARVWDYTTPS